MMARRLAAVVPETGSTNEPEVAEGAWARSHISMTRARTVEAYSDNSALASARNGSIFATAAAQGIMRLMLPHPIPAPPQLKHARGAMPPSA